MPDGSSPCRTASSSSLLPPVMRRCNPCPSPNPSPGVDPDTDPFTEGLFRLATDPSLAVRRAVCAGLVHMLQLQPGLLAPQMRDVIQYMLESTQVRLARRARCAGVHGIVASAACHYQRLLGPHGAESNATTLLLATFGGATGSRC